MEFRTKREAEEARLTLEEAVALLEAEAKTYAATSPRRQDMEQCAARLRALLHSLPE